MTNRPTDKLRREPRQDRSRAMVERILDAGRSVLLERGYDGASTNRVASAAGISPGSLYRYFPDKDVLLSEVIDRYVDGLEARISRAFLDTLGAPMSPDAIRHNVETLLDAFGEHPGLLRVLVEQLPRSGAGRRAGFARRIDELASVALRSHPGAADGRPLDAIAWIVVRTVEHVTISYVLEDPPIARADVVAELTELVIGYLNGHSPSGARVTRTGIERG